MQINRNAYEKLISEDVKWLESKTDDCLERRHITNVLTGSIELVYGKKREPEGRQDADGHPGNSVIDLNGMLSSVKESIEKTVLDVLGENGVVDVNGKEVLLDTFDSVTDDFYLKEYPLKAVFASAIVFAIPLLLCVFIAATAKPYQLPETPAVSEEDSMSSRTQADSEKETGQEPIGARIWVRVIVRMAEMAAV
ncbi:MAG: hypothetical protein IJ904_01660, partial [Candidatus Methanomethylophilaceae archaeon]|nr:hypothetical protein [Candidatus Methanomethylophilaceae archaeon]